MNTVESTLEYRVYSMGDDGHIIRASQFIAATDEIAFEEARQFVDGCDVEVWNGCRFVGRLGKAARPSVFVIEGGPDSVRL